MTSARSHLLGYGDAVDALQEETDADLRAGELSTKPDRTPDTDLV